MERSFVSIIIETEIPQHIGHLQKLSAKRLLV